MLAQTRRPAPVSLKARVAHRENGAQFSDSPIYLDAIPLITCPNLADEAPKLQALYQNTIIFLTYNPSSGNLDSFMQA